MPSRPSVLVVEHEKEAGPEMFEGWLSAAGMAVDVLRPYGGDVLPERVSHGGLMVLGGSMGACDDREVPWLPHVRTMLAEATARGLPVLGICLGGQMLAAACGGRVEPSPSGSELGLGRIDLNDEGRRDRLFEGMGSPVEAAQWHDDEITQLPKGAVLLGSSSRCEVQAFRLGDRAWGVQFHPEASGAVMQAWADAEDSLPPARQRQVEVAIAEVRAAEDRLFACWQGFAARFAAIVKEGSL
ncbi:MAG TPA: type 1 glutamine amidotransferase [Acidimicrobiales bacterium]|nr:type 1 glutamine amidotransferase [Acidimicrobiales bacterium]